MKLKTAVIVKLQVLYKELNYKCYANNTTSFQENQTLSAQRKSRESGFVWSASYMTLSYKVPRDWGP